MLIHNWRELLREDSIFRCPPQNLRNCNLNIGNLYIFWKPMVRTRASLFLLFCPTPWGGVRGKKLIFSLCKVVERAVWQCFEYAQRVTRTRKPPIGRNFDFEKWGPTPGPAPPPGDEGVIHPKAWHVIYQIKAYVIQTSLQVSVSRYVPLSASYILTKKSIFTKNPQNIDGANYFRKYRNLSLTLEMRSVCYKLSFDISHAISLGV